MARSRAALGFFAPLILIALAAAVWSVAWYYLANEAEARIDLALADAASRGQSFGCGNRTFGGFPFRIEIDCSSPQLILENSNSRVTISAARLVGVGLVYQPDTAIVEVAGPTEIEVFTLGGERQNYRVSTDSLRASFGFEDGSLANTSLIANSINAEIPPLGLLNGNVASGLVMERAALHLRKADAAAYDLAFTFDGPRLNGELAIALFEASTLDANKFDFLGRVTKTDALKPGPPSSGLSAWQAAGGELQVQYFTVDAPALDVRLSGTGRLDEFGRAEGKFRGTFGRLDQLIDNLKVRGVLDDKSALLAAGAVGLLARPVEGGTKAELPVKIGAGEVYLGPIKTMELPAFF